MRTKAEDEAFVLFALQAPVASDLRAVLSTMQNVADVETDGAFALDVAIARRRNSASALPEEVIGSFARNGPDHSRTG